MRNASGHQQCKEKMSGSNKKSEREHVRHFLHKKVSILEVSRRSSEKQLQRNVLHVQSCFFAN